MNDKELILLLRTDPQQGLTAAVSKYSAYVYKIAYNRLSGQCTKEDIEEAVSDVFMKLYTSVSERGTVPHSMSAYIAVITQRQCTDILRRSCGSGERISFEDIENTVYDDDIAADSIDLMYAVKQLGEPDTQIFIRRYYMGEPVKNIAKSMDMKTDTVSKRLSRGLLKLRKILEEGS
ncbi:MAG: sigma-70 family RNA polymerase sigma factor [Ruminococcus sp.]|jgi:RNA polymerase sigma-70 factor (ECF subfamily)|nr:sigma-70 family RNA polymerase sigma factor [Ruminococcus sp.]